MNPTLGIHTHESLIRIHVVEEHRSKIPDLLNQMYHEMDEYVKESQQEVSLKETYHLKHVIFKTIQQLFINDFFRDCIKEEAKPHDFLSGFFWQYVLDPDCKHHRKHDIAVVSLDWKHFVLFSMNKSPDLGCVTRGNFYTMTEVAKFLLLLLGEFYGRHRWMGTGTVRT